MLTIVIPAKEGFNQITQEFVELEPSKVLQLEHSLLSISKWESKWHKPFLTKEEKTSDEMIDYIKCMTITQNVDPKVYDRITNEAKDKIADYLEDTMTATTFQSPDTGKKPKEIITAELIYYWMISSNIPFECQKWHINKLLTLINVCNIKNSKPQKMPKKLAAEQRKALNESRRAAHKTKG